MKILLDKNEFLFDDIISLINNQIEESVYLEFKSSDSLEKSDRKKKDISKDISSFANSDGGIIIYGIKEDNHKASELSFIDGNIFTKEWLEQIIQSSIKRPIPDLQIFPIREDNRIDRSIYVVKIPESYDSPHMCIDNRFYKRNNFQSFPMEEYEIRRLFNKSLKTKLIFDGFSTGVKKKESFDPRDKQDYVISFLVQNISNAIEKDYKINISITDFDESIKFFMPREYPSTFFPINNGIQISVSNTSPIFQGEVISAAALGITVSSNQQTMIEQITNGIVELKLFFSNGIDEVKYNLSDLFS